MSPEPGLYEGQVSPETGLYEGQVSPEPGLYEGQVSPEPGVVCPCRQTEMDESVAALKEKHEREKNLLTEENRKLTAETDKVTETF